MSRPVVIAGGGIGGLAAALSLAGQGFEVLILEQSERLAEVGAGIQLAPNCTRVLFDLGLEAPLREIAFVPEGGEMRVWDSGEVLTASRLGAAVERQTGFPYLHVHRADLVAVLAQAVTAHPAIELRAGVQVRDVAIAAGHVDIVAAAAQTTVTLAAPVLIGADGIHSAVRQAVFGPQSPRFTGNVAWRALVPASSPGAAGVPPLAVAWWGPGAHFVHYYVRRGELVNCVCVVESRDWCEESWAIPGDHGELAAAFAGWHPKLQALIHAIDPATLHKWALFDRAPMAAWGRGRATLLGDACHPTLPFMAQGAAMAIEDGAVLARCLRQADLDDDAAVAAVLQRYQRLRIDRTAAIQRGSRRNARIFHLRGLSAWARNVYVRHGRPRNPWARLFEYDALTAHLSAD